MRKFIAAVREGSLLFSDLLPYYSGSEEEFYVPVPYYRSEKINTLDYGLSFTDLCLQYEARRDHENLAYIRAGGVKAYLQPFGEDEAPEQENTALAGAVCSGVWISGTAARRTM